MIKYFKHNVLILIEKTGIKFMCTYVSSMYAESVHNVYNATNNCSVYTCTQTYIFSFINI